MILSNKKKYQDLGKEGGVTYGDNPNSSETISGNYIIDSSDFIVKNGGKTTIMNPEIERILMISTIKSLLAT
ncbi:hypothetical protein PG637_01720 [Riemerella anatipestifer]|nr:hypothetical protein [Riemerella anatipestifer]MDY3324388.1 hypothetical protein [Riemerella anatipestifer]MDY3353203.1 hypothetical protein [Riemerella anatipestifer]